MLKIKEEISINLDREMDDVVLGIDPGKDGGIALCRIKTRELILAEPMPTIGKGIDSRAITRILMTHTPAFGLCYPFIEDVHSFPGQGVVSMFTFGQGLGRIEGVLEALHVLGQRVHPFRKVSPQAWTGAITRGIPRDEAEQIVMTTFNCGMTDERRKKAQTIAHVVKNWPGANLMPKRKRTPQDGIADAICIMEYGVRYVEENIYV